MLLYILRRLGSGIVTLLGTTLITFCLMRVIPADPAVTIAGPKADPQTLAAIRRDLGLGDPLIVQYARYVYRVAHGDLGRSYLTGRRVSEVILERVPTTLELAAGALGVGFLLGLVIGVVTATRHGSGIDLSVLLGSMVVLSLPVFWVGMLLLYQFGFRWRALPLGGAGHLYAWRLHLGGATLRIPPLGGFAAPRYLLLPAATLALVELAYYSRLVHANMLSTLRSDYIRTARAKGVPTWKVYFKHALRNALIPVITIVGLDFAGLMSGVVLTETVFNWPGLGRLAVQAIFNLDVPLIAGTVLFAGGVVVLANIAVDLVYGLIDPRVQYG